MRDDCTMVERSVIVKSTMPTAKPSGSGSLPENVREVRHRPTCGGPTIKAPILQCAQCARLIPPLRCFGYEKRPGLFIAECVDLDLLTQGRTLEDAIGKLQEAMSGYLDVAFDGPTAGLVLRPSPLAHRLRYQWHRLWGRLPGQHGGFSSSG